MPLTSDTPMSVVSIAVFFDVFFVPNLLNGEYTTQADIKKNFQCHVQILNE